MIGEKFVGRRRDIDVRLRKQIKRSKGLLVKVYGSGFYFGDTYIFIIFKTGRMENLKREIKEEREY